MASGTSMSVQPELKVHLQSRLKYDTDLDSQMAQKYKIERSVSVMYVSLIHWSVYKYVHCNVLGNCIFEMFGTHQAQMRTLLLIKLGHTCSGNMFAGIIPTPLQLYMYIIL